MDKTALSVATIFFIFLILLPAINRYFKKKHEDEKPKQKINNSFSDFEFEEESPGKQLNDLEIDTEIGNSCESESFKEDPINESLEVMSEIKKAEIIEKTLLCSKEKRYKENKHLTNRKSIIVLILKVENRPMTSYQIKCIFCKYFSHIEKKDVMVNLNRLQGQGVVLKDGFQEENGYKNTLWKMKNQRSQKDLTKIQEAQNN